MLIRHAILLTLACCAILCRAEPPTSKPATEPAAATPKVTPAEFEKLAADKDNVILDVRTPAEFADGHIPGAVNVDYRSKDFPAKIAALDKSKTYLVYCASGGRSTSACGKLSRLDFSHLYNLDGGIMRWQREGKKVEKQ